MCYDNLHSCVCPRPSKTSGRKYGAIGDCPKGNFLEEMHRMCLGGVTVRVSDLRSSGRGFDSGPGRAAIKLPRSTQPSVSPGQVNRVPAWLPGVEAGRVYFYGVADNTV